MFSLHACHKLLRRKLNLQNQHGEEGTKQQNWSLDNQLKHLRCSINKAFRGFMETADLYTFKRLVSITNIYAPKVSTLLLCGRRMYGQIFLFFKWGRGGHCWYWVDILKHVKCIGDLPQHFRAMYLITLAHNKGIKWKLGFFLYQKI